MMHMPNRGGKLSQSHYLYFGCSTPKHWHSFTVIVCERSQAQCTGTAFLPAHSHTWVPILPPTQQKWLGTSEPRNTSLLRKGLQAQPIHQRRVTSLLGSHTGVRSGVTKQDQSQKLSCPPPLPKNLLYQSLNAWEADFPIHYLVQPQMVFCFELHYILGPVNLKAEALEKNFAWRKKAKKCKLKALPLSCPVAKTSTDSEQQHVKNQTPELCKQVPPLASDSQAKFWYSWSPHGNGL